MTAKSAKDAKIAKVNKFIEPSFLAILASLAACSNV
jgi:hypothetical protein